MLEGKFLIVSFDAAVTVDKQDQIALGDEVVMGWLAPSVIGGALVIYAGHPDQDGPDDDAPLFAIPWSRIRKVYADKVEKIRAQPKIWVF